MCRASIKLLAMAVVMLLALPIGYALRLVLSQQHMLLFGSGLARISAFILELRVLVSGRISENRPLLVVSNHISYLDIVALSSAAPVTFTPKSEIASWPVINWLCNLMGCIYVDRRRSRTKENLDHLHAGLEAGKPLVLFAEGSTSDGKRLLPIRSSYFQLAETFQKPLHIQPVLLRYLRIHNLPIDEVTRHQIAWVGDQDLLPHLIALLKLGPITVSVEFLPVIDVSHCKNRKEIASQCEAVLSAALRDLL